MAETTVLTLVDGVKTVVPNSLDLITPDILREQQDFFEDELKFVRKRAWIGPKSYRYWRWKLIGKFLGVARDCLACELGNLRRVVICARDM
jgi:hypothetical protein